MRSKKVWKIGENLEKIKSLKRIVENQTEKERIREVLDQCQLTLKPKPPKSLFFFAHLSPHSSWLLPPTLPKDSSQTRNILYKYPFPVPIQSTTGFHQISFLCPNSLELVISKVPLVFWSSMSQFTKRGSSILLVSSKFPLVFWNCIFVCKMTAWPKMIVGLKIKGPSEVIKTWGSN